MGARDIDLLRKFDLITLNIVLKKFTKLLSQVVESPFKCSVYIVCHSVFSLNEISRSFKFK